MLHNNHIIKTLSNAILPIFIIGVIFNTISIQSMAGLGNKQANGAITKNDEKQGLRLSILPTPPQPPFGK